jgi:hypothetical protein
LILRFRLRIFKDFTVVSSAGIGFQKLHLVYRQSFLGVLCILLVDTPFRAGVRAENFVKIITYVFLLGLQFFLPDSFPTQGIGFI